MQLHSEALPYVLGLDGTVIAASSDGHYWILDEADGRIRGKGNIAVPVVAPPAAVDGLLLLASDNQIIGIDLVKSLYDTPGGDWSFRLKGKLRAIGMAPQGEMLLVLVEKDQEEGFALCGISPKSRNQQWAVGMRFRSEPLSHIAANSEIVFSGYRDGSVVFLNAKDGRVIISDQFPAGLKWASRAPDGRFLVCDARDTLMMVSLKGKRIFFPAFASSQKGSVYAVSCNRFGTICVRSGSISRFDTLGTESAILLSGRSVTTAPLLRGPTAILLADDGVAFYVDLSSAGSRVTQLIRLIDTGDRAETPLMATQSSVIVGTRNGVVNCFRVFEKNE